jgi:hypothetical protein
VEDKAVRRWFGDYLDAFAACGRGEREADALLAHYGVPLLLATDDGFIALTGDDQVVAAAQQQIDGMRAADYDHSDVLTSDVTVLNATSALYRGAFSRRRADGTEINRLTVTYLVTDGSAGRRISALALHSPD